MTYLQAILLAVVQGIGEFLPISSSGHLVIVPYLARFKDPGLGFDVALHFGTLLALLTVYYRDFLQLIPLPTSRFTTQKKFVLYSLILATIPATVVGLLFKDFAESWRHPLFVAFNLFVGGFFLWRSDCRFKDNNQFFSEEFGYVKILKVGMFQCLALMPGVSRSGITITAGLVFGLSRAESARLSFLMAVPVTFGACLLKMKDLQLALTQPQSLLAIVVSALVGYGCIRFLLHWIKTRSMQVFFIYRAFLAVIICLVYFSL